MWASLQHCTRRLCGLLGASRRESASQTCDLRAEPGDVVRAGGCLGVVLALRDEDVLQVAFADAVMLVHASAITMRCPRLPDGSCWRRADGEEVVVRGFHPRTRLYVVRDAEGQLSMVSRMSLGEPPLVGPCDVLEDDGERMPCCVACVSTASTLAGDRCGHLCLCEPCHRRLRELRDLKCPICQTRTDFRRIYA
jgi:hypothetical protein